MANEPADYEKDYSEGSLWDKCRKNAIAAGRELIEKALWLFYAAARPETPVWAKTTVFGALGYFISPIDVIPDAVPLFGFSDDLAVVLSAVRLIWASIDDEVKRKAAVKLADWFGPAAAPAAPLPPPPPGADQRLAES